MTVDLPRDEGDDSWLDLESVDRILGTARSVRRNLDFERPVELDVLFDCINLATQAPTGLGGENWRFLVVTDKQQKSQLANLYVATITELQRERGLQLKPTQQALMRRLPDIPAMILVCAIGEVPGPETANQVAFYGSVLPAAWSLMLALRSRNLGSTWTSLLASRSQDVARVLNIPDDVVQTVMLPVGYMKGATLRRAEREDARKVTFLNRWGELPPDS
jgi:nitroreductase